MRLTLVNGLVGASAAIVLGGQIISRGDQPRPVVGTVVSAVAPVTVPNPEIDSVVGAGRLSQAIHAFIGKVRDLSHPRALETAFHSYFAFLSENPQAVDKPYLYFVDYGIPATEPRGYVFPLAVKSPVARWMVTNSRIIFRLPMRR